MSQFNIGDVVKVRGSIDFARREGVVQHLTCIGATGKGGNICRPSHCNHSPKDRVWVKWPNEALCSYSPLELDFDSSGEESMLEEIAQMLDNGSSSEQLHAIQSMKTVMRSRRNRLNHQAVVSEASQPQVTESSSGTGEEVVAPSLGSMIKNDGAKAAYRIAAHNLNKGVQEAIVRMLKNKGASSSQLEGITMFLQSEFGAAALSVLSGYGLQHAPVISKDTRAQKLAAEFRVGGLSVAGNKIVDMFTDQLKPILEGALANLPGEELGRSESQESQKLMAAIPSTEEEEVQVDYEETDHSNKEVLRAVEGK